MTERRPKPPKEPNPEENLELAEGMVEFYCDALNLHTGVWGATLYLGELRPGKKSLIRAKMKVSPQMLRALSLLTGKHLRDYERNVGPVALPNEMVHGWGLEEEMR